MINIEVKGLKELIQRMEQYPDKLKEGMNEAMLDTLLVMNEKVPKYPPPPHGAEVMKFINKRGKEVSMYESTSSYRRTGTLGRSIGGDIGPSMAGEGIFEVRGMGSEVEGHFGTRLSYAPYVIGDGTQAKVHQGRWWTISTIVERAMPKINRIWEMLGSAMAAFLEGK